MDFNFADKLIIARQEKRLTQKQLADRLGVTAQAVSKWETGGSLPDLEMFRTIAKQLDCSADFLLEHEVTRESRINMLAVERTVQLDDEIGFASGNILTITVGKALIPMLEEGNADKYQDIFNMRFRLAREWGIIVPVIRLMDDPNLADDEYRILLFEKVVVKWRLEYPKRFYLQNDAKAIPEERLVKEPVHGGMGIWSDREIEGCSSLPAMELVLAQLQKVILDNYDAILNRQIVSQLTEVVRKRFPATVAGVVPEKVGLSRLQRVIGGLVVQGCPVNRLNYIIEFLEDHPEEDPDRQIEELKILLRQGRPVYGEAG